MNKTAKVPKDKDGEKSAPITKEEVWRAVKKLRREKLRVTVRNIYDELGRRGSFSTIQNFLDEIKIEEANELHKLNEEMFVTEELNAKGIELVMSVAESLMEKVRSKLEASNAQAVSLIKEQAENTQQLRESVDNQNAELDDMAAQIKELEDKVAQLTRDKTDLEMQVKQERQRADSAERGMQVVDAIQRKLNELMKAKED